MTPEEQAQMAQEVMVEAQEEVRTIQRDLHTAWLTSTNLVPNLDEATLNDISSKVVDEYKIDRDSLDDWLEEYKEAHNLARQLKDKRTWAGEAIADIKYPIISTACIQFQARAFPAIIKGGKVVKPKIVGNDEGGVKAAKGQRASDFMSWQLVDDNPRWVDDVDWAMMALPLTGVMFKKTYRDKGAGKNESETIYPTNLVVNYFAKDFEPRATHKVYLYPNEIQERINTGVFVDFDYGEAVNEEDDSDDEKKKTHTSDPDEPHLFLEQHRWYDLDDDGYQEPYVATVHWGTDKVVRLVPRWSEEDAEYDAQGRTIRIKPFPSFTRILFMPAFDGSFYGMGFGRLLSPLNKAVDSIINQLLDAGGYQNRPAGFVSSGVRFGKNNGVMKFKKGEWKKIQTAGNLKDNVFQLNFGEPSAVLFQLLGLLMEASNKLASMSDVLSGEIPKGDIPATTTLSMIEQGLKVYTAVHLRIHRALKSEYAKLWRLNRIFAMDMDAEYKRVIEGNFSAHMDFNSSDYDLVPVSNEADISDTMRTLKADALMQHYGTGRMNDEELLRRWLEAHGFDDTEKLISKEPPPPDPELLLKDREVQVKEAGVQLAKIEFLAAQQERVYKMLKMYAEAINKFADAEAKEEGTQMAQYQQFVQGALATSQKLIEQVGGSLGGQVQQGDVRPMEEGPGNAGVPPEALMGSGDPQGGALPGGMAM